VTPAPDGQQIYNELVSEMNINKTGLPLAIHRKKSVSFRDKSLLEIFQMAMQTLGQLMSGTYGQITSYQVLEQCGQGAGGGRGGRGQHACEICPCCPQRSLYAPKQCPARRH